MAEVEKKETVTITLNGDEARALYDVINCGVIGSFNSRRGTINKICHAFNRAGFVSEEAPRDMSGAVKFHNSEDY